MGGKVNKTTDEIFEIVVKSIPYPQHMSDIETHEDHIRFTWRGDRFRVSKSLHVEEVTKGCLSGSNLAIFLRSILERKAFELELQRDLHQD